MGNKQSSSSSNSDPESPPRQQQLNGTNGTANNPSYYSIIKNSYQQLVNAIIRPPRCRYTIEQLGPKEFVFCGKSFHRIDFTLKNPRNQSFECSLWEPAPSDRHCERLPCVIYMHGNSSARIEALSTLSMILGMGASLLAIDFAGSGLSEGEYVSLGAFEKDDLAAAIEYLRNSQKITTIALWGRSMGAATALLHAERDPSIAGMILDSAFSDLVVLAEDMVEKGRQQGLFAPSFLVYVAIKFVRSSVQKAAGFDIRALCPIEHADRCFVPALFIAAEHDQFVLPKHSRSIYDKYGGDKNLVMVEGDHNSPRPRYLYDTVAIFLQQTLQLPSVWTLPGSEYYVRRLPWAYAAGLGGGGAPNTQTSKPSAITLNDSQRLQSYIAKQHELQNRQQSHPQQQSQLQKQQPQLQKNPSTMYESDDDDDEANPHDGSTDISSLMAQQNGNDGLTDAETELLMLQMMDEDEALSLALAESLAETAPTDAGPMHDDVAASSLSDVQQLQNTHEEAMQANVENSLFSLLRGGGNGTKTKSNPSETVCLPPIPSASSSSSQSSSSSSSTHVPLAKTKVHSSRSYHREGSAAVVALPPTSTTYTVPVAPPPHAHDDWPMSPTAKLAAESLLRQQQQQQQQHQDGNSAGGEKDAATAVFGLSSVVSRNSSLSSVEGQQNPRKSLTSLDGSSPASSANSPTKKRIFFDPEDDSADIDSPAFSQNSQSNSRSQSRSGNSSLKGAPTTVLPAFPTSPSSQKAAHAMTAKSSFHTFHNVFDQLDSDSGIRKSSGTSSSSGRPPIGSSSSTSSASISTVSSQKSLPRIVQPPPVSATQLLSMADPFDDEEEVDVEVIDADGTKRLVKQRRKKVDEFADGNEAPIFDSEIVGMDETLEELSMNLGSASAEFLSHLNSKNASAHSSQHRFDPDSHNNSSSNLLMRDNGLSSSTVVAGSSSTNGGDASTHGVSNLIFEPAESQVPRRSQQAEALLLDEDV